MARYDITALDSALEFDTSNAFAKYIVAVPGTNKFVIAWYNATDVLYVQCFSVNTSTGVITAIGSPIDIEPGLAAASAVAPSITMIDASNLAVFWLGPAADGYCQLLSLDGTGNVSTNGSALEFDTTNGSYISSVLMDSTHILAAWDGTNNDGFASIFTVNTGSGSITVTGTPFEFDTADYFDGSLKKINATKAVVFYRGTANDGYARVLDINTSTWAVSAAGATLEWLDVSTINGNATVVMDESSSPMRVVNIWNDGGTTKCQGRSFSIDTSTYDITAFGSTFDIQTSAGSSGYPVSAHKIDSTHIVSFYAGLDTDGYARVLTLNTSTGDLSYSANEIEFETDIFSYSSSCDMGNGLYVCAWSGTASDGFVRAFQVTQTNIKSYNTNTLSNIKSINTNVIANVKSLNTNT